MEFPFWLTAMSYGLVFLKEGSRMTDHIVTPHYSAFDPPNLKEKALWPGIYFLSENPNTKLTQTGVFLLF